MRLEKQTKELVLGGTSMLTRFPEGRLLHAHRGRESPSTPQNRPKWPSTQLLLLHGRVSPLRGDETAWMAYDPRTHHPGAPEQYEDIPWGWVSVLDSL